jgi:hypothetical protein
MLLREGIDDYNNNRNKHKNIVWRYKGLLDVTAAAAYISITVACGL